MQVKGTPEERFWAKVQRTETCWLWTAAVNNNGYGVFRPTPERAVYAHRYTYALLVGPVPPGRELDHLCRVTACVRPSHLEPVTHRENMLRSDTPAARQARQTQCRRGHALIGANVYRRPGKPNKRECRRCAADREARRVRNARKR